MKDLLYSSTIEQAASTVLGLWDKNGQRMVRVVARRYSAEDPRFQSGDLVILADKDEKVTEGQFIGKKGEAPTSNEKSVSKPQEPVLSLVISEPGLTPTEIYGKLKRRMSKSGVERKLRGYIKQHLLTSNDGKYFPGPMRGLFAA